MATKIRDYNKLAADICAAVGRDNIIQCGKLCHPPAPGSEADAV